jgi:rubredoxin
VRMVLFRCVCVYVYVLDKGERSGGVDSIVY